MAGQVDVQPKYTRDKRSPLPCVVIELHSRMQKEWRLVGEAVMWRGRAHRCMIELPRYYVTFTVHHTGRLEDVRHCVIQVP